MDTFRLLLIRIEKSTPVQLIASVLAGLYEDLYLYIQNALQSHFYLKLRFRVLSVFRRYYPYIERTSRDGLQKLQEEYSRLYSISEEEISSRFDLDKNGTEWFFGLSLGVALGVVATLFTLIFG